MLPDPRSLAERVSAETGLEFAGAEGRDPDGTRWLELHPAGHPAARTFTLRTVVGWRRIDVHFRPGSFAGDLMRAMGSADPDGRQAFCAILDVCGREGAEVHLTLNGTLRSPGDPTIWDVPWRSLGMAVRRGMLAINEGNPESDLRLTELWTSRVAAAVLALLPVEVETEGELAADVSGFPEGGRMKVEVNRYERDRRNRAAAITIHGHICRACDLDMGRRYGPAAAGLIEIHHVTPVSALGKGYIIDPRTDLVPLCPNCHSVAHRRNPPFSVDEVHLMLQRTQDG